MEAAFVRGKDKRAGAPAVNCNVMNSGVLT